MPLYCVTADTTFQEASREIREAFKVPEGALLYVVGDIETIRPVACHRCGARHCMVIHQYRVRYSQDLFGVVVYIVVVRFKCSVCGTTITVIPFFVHCCHVYDAHAIYTCLYHRVATGKFLLKWDGVPVCPSWWLQQRWYKDFRYQTGFGNPTQEEMLGALASLSHQAIILQSNYVRMEQYPSVERNPSLHHGLRVAMPFPAGYAVQYL
jgi:hypothetical protein